MLVLLLAFLANLWKSVITVSSGLRAEVILEFLIGLRKDLVGKHVALIQEVFSLSVVLRREQK